MHGLLLWNIAVPHPETPSRATFFCYLICCHYLTGSKDPSGRQAIESKCANIEKKCRQKGVCPGRGVVVHCRRKASADKDLAPIIEESRKKAGLFKGQPPKLTPEEIIQFIFFPVVNEGCRVIDEGIVDKPSDLDVATVMSMGFPAYR